ncbi:tRNA glutamyl-Q(34) synthetase GluQRS [Polynucleobacter sp. HIN7]|uniref:tRNA glutamyl-Q(34) synthetase GluQRS n=1 Tax=Polynucleobacter sp. HIN7 TaxID=3047866 RepID=UPI0025722506|nr:tRNA glutamyl-Q(34) synthetase GluQRS [Polynucleobacter sp. HIN7]
MTTSLNPQFNQGTRSGGSRQSPKPYRGRFAPSPTGPLHLGSLTTALGSWLDARAHGGMWLVRIEDVDTPRTVPGADQLILEQLKAYGLEWDEEPTWQSERTSLYQKGLDQLIAKGLIYGCQCSRKQIEDVLQLAGVSISPNQELIYPGTCREQHLSIENHALRMRLPKDCVIGFVDRGLGKQSQDLHRQVGDFVLRRADGLFTYQLAVVVDDQAQRVTHVVRGADLLSNTARQIYLQCALGYETPHYLHLPLVTNTAGEKLSKQTQAAAIEMHSREIMLATLNRAAHYLGIADTTLAQQISIAQWLGIATERWNDRLVKECSS